MKTFFLVLMALFSIQIHAKCMSGNITTFPQSPSLKKNSCLLIEGYGVEQSIIDGLNNDYPIYLESENNHKVNLLVAFKNQGSKRVNQAILEPEQDLKDGETYYLKVDNLDKTNDEGRPLHYWNPNKSKVHWKVESALSHKPLAKLLSPPKLVDKDTTHFGCGPSVTAKFEFITNRDSDYLIETELLDLKTDKSTVYYLKPPKEGLLVIGHGMCSGAFSFAPEHHYKIRFNIINSCNNASTHWTNWIEFDSPFESFSKQSLNKN